MRGHFLNGHIEVDDEAFPDGTPVNFVVVRDPNDEEYELTPEEEDALEQSIAEIERGECVTAEDLLAELRTMRLRDDANDVGRPAIARAWVKGSSLLASAGLPASS